MKRLFIVGVFICALSLLCACVRQPPEVESSIEESSSTPEPVEISKPVTYTMEEAASNNAGISSSSVNLVQFEEPEKDGELAVVKTTHGDLYIRLFPEYAPKAVENFITHAKAGYYNGLTFDKIMNNFIIEGGDPDGEGGDSAFKDAEGRPERFENEYSLNLWHFRGAVSMSHVDGKNDNGSRFFIVQASFVDAETVDDMKKAKYPDKVIERYEEVGGTPGFDFKRTIFGMLDQQSLETLDAIALVEAEDDGTPHETVLIESIEIRAITSESESSSEESSDSSES